MSNTYRVTLLVTTDVKSDTHEGAIQDAMNKIRALVNDDPNENTGSPARPCWVTGIASHSDGEYMVYKLEN